MLQTGSGKEPLVTIGMPVYNSERHVRRALDSVLAQSYTNLEIIISDNGSTDSTHLICQEYAARDSRIRLLRNDSNKGVIANFNIVLAAASGTYFKAMSSHDAIAPTFIETGVRRLEQVRDAVLYYTVVRKIEESGELNGQYTDGFELLDSNPMDRFLRLQEKLKVNNPMYGLIRRDKLLQTGFLRPCLASDIIAMAELSLQGKFLMGTEPLMMRRIDPFRAYTEEDYRREQAFCTGRPISNRPPMVFVRMNAEYLLACCRSSMSFQNRLQLVWFIVRNLYWARERLAQEIGQQLAWLLHLDHRSVKRSEISL